MSQVAMVDLGVKGWEGPCALPSTFGAQAHLVKKQGNLCIRTQL